MKSKKGALSLSVSAIVILVIAFVVLGLALTLTRYVFKLGMAKTGEAIDIVELEMQPSLDNPIAMSDKIIIGKGELKDIKIGVYNTKESAYEDANLEIKDCIKSGETEASTDQPTLTSIDQTIGPSQSAGYKAIISIPSNMSTGNYICKLKVTGTGESCPEEVCDERQFYLIVTA